MSFSSARLTVLATALSGFFASAALAAPFTLTAAGGPISDGTATAGVETDFVFINPLATGSVASIESVTLTGLSHTYSGDLLVTLLYIPDSLTAPIIQGDLFDQVNNGANTYNNNFSGNYSFTDEAATTLQASVGARANNAIIASGTFKPSEFYLGTTAGGGTPVVVNLDTTFAGADLDNGDFVLAIVDFGPPDAGALVSATLNLTTAGVPEPTSLALLGLGGLSMLRRSRRA